MAQKGKKIKPVVVEVGQEIEVPELVGRLKTPIGFVEHVLRPPSVETVVEVEELSVSSRRKVDLCILGSGEQVILTNSNRLDLPEGVDGVLAIENRTWLRHKSSEAFSVCDLSEYRKSFLPKWDGALRFKAETVLPSGDIERGLRPAQLGALHSVLGHWSVEQNPATVVMPTGTGKTEVVLAASIQFADERAFLIVVPNGPLRSQTFRKFRTLGLLRHLGVLPQACPNPIVGVVEKRPTTIADLAMFEHCHVVIGTMSSLSQGTAVALQSDVAERVSTLVLDEAHHVAAPTWTSFKESFSQSRVLQLTATPYRRDGKLVDGSVVFNYGLREAQNDGYFKPIEFRTVFEYDENAGDRKIAEAAISQLKDDLTAGFNHLVMARCSSIKRAEDLVKIYEDIAPEYSPRLVHSKLGVRGDENLAALQSFESRIVVCVDMLGEGFDLPNLKIAALHDVHKSLAVLLQFTGRFTRSAGDEIGTATVVANIANQNVSIALERLYQEDADWNSLLSDFSSQAARDHRELIKFLEESVPLSGATGDHVEIAANLLTPKCSATVFKCSEFHPKRFLSSISKTTQVVACWLHNDSNTLYFVTRREAPVGWTRSKEIRDVAWDLYVVHFDKDRGLLFINASDNSSLHESLANAVADNTAKLMRGEVAFKTLGNISRLRFQQIGVKKAGRRNLSYAMYTGSEVQSALTASQKAGAYKSNLAGTGFSNGMPVTVGCSYKGRVWSKDKGPIREFLDWCNVVGEKLVDNSIDPSSIIDNVLVPEEIAGLPADISVLSAEWPDELIRQSTDRVVLVRGIVKTDLSFVDIVCSGTDYADNSIGFVVRGANWCNEYRMAIGGSAFEVTRTKGAGITVTAGRLGPMPLTEYLGSYPPLFLLSDLSEINGNLWIRPNSSTIFSLPADRFEAWDWSETDITQESMWKNGVLRKKSIQFHVARQLEAAGCDVVFDDDAAGEAADLICLRELEDRIELSLVHCKFSGSSTTGERVKDVVEVCSQAIRSTKWNWKFNNLCKHIQRREMTLKNSGRATRFAKGSLADVNRFQRLHRQKELKTRIVIVQPGLKENCSDDQRYVLAATDSYLGETVNVKLEIICGQ